MLSRVLFVALVALTCASCASYFTRKDCEKTNWYQHGYDVAMSGRRLDADDYIKKCQKAEAKMSFTDMDTGFKAGMGKYCTSDNVYEVGKAGSPFAYEMCDGENLNKMRGRYTEGLRVFCTPGSAYRFGTSGGVYQNVCPKNTEDAWLTEYRKGRKIYLSALIEQKEDEVRRMDSEIGDLERRKRDMEHEQTMLIGQTEVRTEQVYDPATGTYVHRTSTVPSESAKMRTQQLSNDISSLNFEIDSVRTKQRNLSSEVSKLRTEMVTL